MRLGMLAALLVLAACAETPRPYAPVGTVRYTAMGENPFWMVTIGDDRIVLRTGGEDGGAEHAWPRTLPRTVDGVRTWESADGGTAVIAVEAAPGPCTGSNGFVYEDNVRVRLSGRGLSGCGGRLLERAPR